ncbi:MAG: Asp-tRNA(Asn)/Glu-tRNA(Gln) amidotransferase subunit GatB [Planctomycetia bacterium]|nr:Asp-tRNA(Asn)/Glu-tRNA(Gln) amidotransferase subunit GatB [Planctomycetia bacterium]
MTTPYETIIGLEVHVQLQTRTKLFCGCPTTFGLPPNSATCPVCLGLPGALPVLNRHAFQLALRAAAALNCQIPQRTKWDRKNYFYPDLPKGYQISQYDQPLGGEGYLDIPRRIGIIRAHLEEDAGKLTHEGNLTLVDLNRAGMPLLEIVGKPELTSPEEAKIYLEEMAGLMRDIGVSDCRMEEGSLRCDANVNIRVGDEVTPIVEIKNLNSFRFLERAVRYEASRQYERFQRDSSFRFGKVPKQTWGWDEVAGVTRPQREKEEAADYRYFPDPDLVPIRISPEQVAAARAEVGELPSQARERLASQYGLSSYDVGVLMGMGRTAIAYFDRASAACGDSKTACNWITNQVAAVLKETNTTLDAFALSAERLGGLIAAQKRIGLSRQQALDVFAKMIAEPLDADAAISALGVTVVSDDSAIVEAVRRAMAANPKAVSDYRKGKKAAANSLKGAVMKELRGAGRADVVDRVLQTELERHE